MTEQEIRELVADTAVEYLGCNESDGSHRTIIDLYNRIRPLPRGYKMTYYDPWCAAFVSAVGEDTGMTDIILPECSCDAMINLYKAKGLWKEADDYTPQVGDIAMYDWDDTGRGDNLGSADHVGIVYAKDGNSLTIVEGNISDSVDFRSIKINGKYIRGYCCPDYASVAGDKPPPDKLPSGAPETIQTPFVSVKLPILNKWAAGAPITAMQALVMAWGYSVGVDGADGEFGDNTERGVMQFQRDRGLVADGICGENTWNELLGL